MTRTRWVVIALGVIVLAGIVWAIARVNVRVSGAPMRVDFAAEVSDVGTTRDVADRYDCPDHSGVRSPSDTSELLTQLSLPGPITTIPEFHDCQRVITRSRGTAYGPRIALFAWQGLAQSQISPAQYRVTVQTSGTGFNSGADDLLGSVSGFGSEPVQVDLGVAQPSVTVVGSQQGPPAFVEVVAWGDYPPLGIKQGFSCLYIVPDKTRPTGLAGKMVHVADESECLKGADQVQGEVTGMLWVYPVLPEGWDPDDVPPVARWDWDFQNQRQVIGVRCGHTWCNIGLENLQVTPTHVPPDGSTSPKASRVFGIKGWYDEQRMAIPVGGQLVPAGQVGKIFPDPELDMITDSASFQNRWIPVAQVMFTTGNFHYSDKFGVDQTAAPPGRQNEVYICTGAGCDFSGLLVPRCLTTHPNRAGAWKWYAKIVSVRGGRPPEFRCVVRHDHKGFLPVATARWRWHPADETMWVRCAAGCCEVTGEE